MEGSEYHVYLYCHFDRNLKSAVLDSMVKESLSEEVPSLDQLGELGLWIS